VDILSRVNSADRDVRRLSYASCRVDPALVGTDKRQFFREQVDGGDPVVAPVDPRVRLCQIKCTDR
jgi:hypothetical protein